MKKAATTTQGRSNPRAHAKRAGHASSSSAPHIGVRVLSDSVIAMGPGKADLLEAIALTGSISAAARAMGMSYRRAWLLVDTMNHCYVAPLVSTEKGGAEGGGASLTPAGQQVLHMYRRIVASVARDFRPLLKETLRGG